ncbi:hypothetical protein H0H93_001415, partial [Arthromyces matolae]
YTADSEAFRKNQTVARAANIAAAAAIQLTALLLPPQESVLQITSGRDATQHYRSAALRVSIESHVAEILNEAGEKKLVKLQSIRTGPIAKHDNTNGFCAFNELLLVDSQKASSYFMENMLDPKTSHSYEPQHAPIQRALGFDTNFWDFQFRPENLYRLKRFGIAMKADIVMPDLELELFDWHALPENFLVVDVGGGIGSSAKTVLSAYPKIKFIIQDLPKSVEDGIKYWTTNDQEKLENGSVHFQVHDFFGPQNISTASVFLLRHILHDWSDTNCIKILKHLRDAATPETTLLILDCVMTTSGVDTTIASIRNTQCLHPPTVLATGFTTVNDLPWALDCTMMASLNSQERTLLQFQSLLKSSGWGITRVVQSGNAIDGIHARPI